MATVKTLEPTVVLLIPRQRFQALTQRNPKLGRILQKQLSETLAKRLDEAIDSA